MEEKLAKTMRFFKVMIPGFHEKLNLPPDFCKKVKQEKSEWATVKSRKGTWKIKVCRNYEGLMCFKDGWANFVNRHGLSIGDTVFFEHIGHLHFNALVFDPTACEKEFVVEFKKGNGGVNGNYNPRNTKGEPAKECSTSCKNPNPHFILTMKPHHAHRPSAVTIPAEFGRAHLRNKSSITLRDPHAKKWQVKLRIQTKPKARWRMSKGWLDFYASNNLKDGDVCVFNLNCGSKKSTTVLMDVQIFPAPL
ncbi:hypothetical protein CDL12_14771 [Handroanthus impetiginosus]|uniref:TF-B3 domain-containing protein n=1 Tax=Handroanthus impetiginosus TaxID=429701 RepID=A0A2G9H529_9LAMI|nr:hypothetical protein CDL12_14771 [Handroanthus impetiginosus]